MGAIVLPFRRRFDPRDPDAETCYDAVVMRLNRLAARRRRGARLCQEIERQIVQNDLVVAAGRRRGQPLTTEGRRRRLAQLLELHDEQRRLGGEIDRLQRELDAMNGELDAWARETYGMGS
jgi:hypothetical protein